MRSPAHRRPQLTPQRRLPWHKRPGVVAVGSASFGFLCGAAFWHMVGFWSFVSDVVWNNRDDMIQTDARDAKDATVAARAMNASPASARTTGTISPVRPTAARGLGRSPGSCSMAVPVAGEGETNVLPCLSGTPAAPTKPLARKGDLELAPTTARGETERIIGPQQTAPQSWAPVFRGIAR